MHSPTSADAPGKPSGRSWSVGSRLILAGVAPLFLMGLATFVVQSIRLREGHHWFGVAEAAQGMRVALGEVRRGEKDFLLRDRRNPEFVASGQSPNTGRVELALDTLRTNLGLLLGNPATRLDPRIGRIADQLANYEVSFGKLVENVRAMGSESSGLEGEWRQAESALRARLRRQSDSQVGALADLEGRSIRFLLRPEMSDLAAFEESRARLQGMIGQDPDLEQYRKAFLLHHQLCQTNGFKETEGLQGRFRAAAHAMAPDIDDLLILAHNGGRDAHTSSLRASGIMFGISIAGGAMVLAYLARGIVRPIRDLTAAAERMKAGGIEVSVPVSEVEEFRTLALSFNAMSRSLVESQRRQEERVEERTRDLAVAKGALEERNEQLVVLVEQLRDSAENSARLAQVAKAANEAKTSFLAVMSHELRTPINGMLGFSELLQQTSLSREQLEFTSIISESANHLLKVVNDILDISRVEQGHMDLQIGIVDLGRLASEVVELLRPQALSKNLYLQLQAADSNRAIIEGDPLRVRQVLLNLVGNSIKFTDVGGVALKLDSEEGKVRVKILDTGPGIPPDKAVLLFNKFVQVDASHSRRHGGVGLGLAISKALVESMGGEIGLESEPGKGSCFWFSLPPARSVPIAVPGGELPAAHESRPTDEPVTEPPRNAPEVERSLDSDSRPRVLLAEDNAINARLAIRMLEQLGFEVSHVKNGQELLAAFPDADWDLLLVDWQMPELDGLEAVRRIRATEVPGSRVPILILTANVMPGDRQHCVEAGADGYVSKPFRRENLRQEMEALQVPVG